MDNVNLFSPLAKIVPLLNEENTLDEYVLKSEFCLSHDIFYSKEKALITFGEISVPTLFLSELNKDTNNILFHDIKKTENICPCVIISYESKPFSRIKYHVDMLFFSLLMNELKRSKIFRCNVLKKFSKFSKKHLKYSKRLLNSCEICNETLLLIHVNVCLSKPKTDILDYKWNKKLERLINERCELENAMAWLSTLGGAFSALGDYFVECAEKAGLISVQQLRLALRLGDPITICQSKIYLAMSLLQKGHYSKTKSLIRELYSFSISPEGSKDFRLKNMCIAVWNKLKYTLSQRRKNQTNQKLLTI